MKPRILLTNDDGIYATGLKALYNALKPIADLTIVAPATQQSAVGLSVTIRTPLVPEAIKWEDDTVAVKVNGTPADCVRVALNVVLSTPPDLIISGINQGSNAGRNVLYSGTVAAIIEATLQGIPGIAYSCESYTNPDYEQTIPFVRSITQHILSRPLPQGSFLNVNFPEKNGIKGIRLASQGKTYVKDNFRQGTHPEGKDYYWTGFQIASQQEPEGSDYYWLQKGYAAAVPIHVHEMTDHTFLRDNAHHFSSLSTD